MGAQPDVHAYPNVASMEEFLSDLLVDADRLDETLAIVHAGLREARDHLRARLYTLRLADDAGFRADVDQLAEEMEAGRRPVTFSLAEVLERQG